MFILEAVGGVGGPKEPHKQPGETVVNKPQNVNNTDEKSFADEVKEAFNKQVLMRKEKNGNTEIAKG